MACVCVLAACLPRGARADTVAVDTEPIDSLDMNSANFPWIRFTGGIVLRSKDPRFGGWSGLATSNEGRDLVAVNDAGYWLTLSVKYVAFPLSPSLSLSLSFDE